MWSWGSKLGQWHFTWNAAVLLHNLTFGPKKIKQNCFDLFRTTQQVFTYIFWVFCLVNVHLNCENFAVNSELTLDSLWHFSPQQVIRADYCLLESGSAKGFFPQASFFPWPLLNLAYSGGPVDSFSNCKKDFAMALAVYLPLVIPIGDGSKFRFHILRNFDHQGIFTLYQYCRSWPLFSICIR